MNNQKYLIIAGTSKSGSTSLFSYLADHPEVEGSTVKQTRFFLEKEWMGHGGKPAYHYTTHPDGFKLYYQSNKKAAKYRVESTPDYLYCKSTPLLIHEHLGDRAQIIFMLRDPIDRILSWYKYGKQIGTVPPQETLSEFLEKNMQKDNKNLVLAYMSVETGHYAKYLKPWYDTFGAENIHIYFLEDLEKDPKSFMRGLCYKLSIEPGFYDAYVFEAKNISRQVKNMHLMNLYRLLRRNFIKIYTAFPTFTHKTIPLIKGVSSSIKKMSFDDLSEHPDRALLKKILSHEYQNEKNNFLNITGVEYPY